MFELRKISIPHNYLYVIYDVHNDKLGEHAFNIRTYFNDVKVWVLKTDGKYLDGYDTLIYSTRTKEDMDEFVRTKLAVVEELSK